MKDLASAHQDEPNYPFLLVTYLICADEQIHIEELRNLRVVAAKLEIDDRTLEEMGKIFSQAEDQLALEEIIHSVPKQDRERTLQLLITMAYADGIYDRLERQFLDEVAKRWQAPREMLDQLCSEAEHVIRQREQNQERVEDHEKLPLVVQIFQRLDALFSRKLVDAITKVAPKSTRRWKESMRRKILLAGHDYHEAIRLCTQVAHEDIVFAEEAIESVWKTLNQLRINLAETIAQIQENVMHGHAKSAREVAKQLRDGQEALEQEILRKIQQLQGSLGKKRRSLNYFTLSFQGKTKAGKSTLHAVLTGEGWDAIGLGQQRKTRYNRVYEWQNIRIIDTPGIGAPGGKCDEEIAKSVVDESDIICFVLTNNNQQETEFQFLRLLRDKSKPLIILLNVQENLKNAVRLRRFLEHPSKLFSEGKNDLGGHIDRIRRYARQFYGNDYFAIIPVQLLAAHLSRHDEHAALKDALYRASRLQDFLDAIQVSLIQEGVIRRSQTLLGCTAIEIQAVYKRVSLQAESYAKLAEELKSRFGKALNRIDTAGNDALRELETRLREVFTDIRNSIQAFAEGHWEDNADVLNRAWKTHLERKKFKLRLEGGYTESAEAYSANVQETLEEIGKEMELVAQFQDFDFRLDEQDSSTLLKNLFRWGGSLMTLTAVIVPFIPGVNVVVGIILGVVGAISGITSFRFASKAEKRHKAVTNISQTLRGQLETHEKRVVKELIEEFRKQQSALRENIRIYFEQLVQGLSGIGSAMRQACGELTRAVEDLRRAYAKRVLDWSEGQLEPLSREAIDAAIDSVEWEPGKAMRVQTRRPFTLKRTGQDLRNVFQEDVHFVVAEPS